MADLPLPRWVHTPGETEPDDETLSRVTTLVPERFDQFVPHDHPALRYGLALNDAGLFWEAHEVLEAVWKAAPKGGRDRILLRACIQIANAGLKHRLDRLNAVTRLLDDAKAELAELAARGPAEKGFAAHFDGSGLAQKVDIGPVQLSPFMKESACFGK